MAKLNLQSRTFLRGKYRATHIGEVKTEWAAGQPFDRAPTVVLGVIIVKPYPFIGHSSHDLMMPGAQNCGYRHTYAPGVFGHSGLKILTPHAAKLESPHKRRLNDHYPGPPTPQCR